MWDPKTCETLATLRHPPGTRGIAAVGFCRESRLLACVGMDNNHTIFVWDWRRGKIVAECKGWNDVPPKVYGVVFDPFGPDPSAFVTYGVNHVKFWTNAAFVPEPPEEEEAAAGKIKSNSNSKSSARRGAVAPPPPPPKKRDYSYVEDSGKFGPVCDKHAVTAATFLPSGRLLTGTPDGAIAVWGKDRRIVRVVRAHAKGPVVLREDGPPTHHGVRCLKLRGDDKTLLSAGADGHVITWDVSSGDLKETGVVGAVAVKADTVTPGGSSASAPIFRGLDCMPGCDVFIAGTRGSDVWEVDDTPRVLIDGHEASLSGVCWHPTTPGEFATASEGELVYVWCARTKRLKRAVGLPGNKARCVGFSPDGSRLAVGCVDGGVHVLDAKSLRRLKIIKTHADVVTDLKFSPCGSMLATCSADQFVDVFDAKLDAYKRLSRCAGHSATVRHLDWSADSETLRSVCSAYEILYFSPASGKQVMKNQRDQKWATWTGVLGFDVMGIWPDFADGTDVNAIDRTRSGRHVATADDFGGVKLFNYPCVVQDAPYVLGRGHSSHVMNVRFSPDDGTLISVGGKDRCVFQVRSPSHWFPYDRDRVVNADP